MKMSMIRNILRDVRGVAAIEFAILAPVMIMMITCTIEAAHLLTVRISLEGAVAEAAREASVKLDLSEDERDEAMRQYILQRMVAFPLHEDRTVEIATTVYRTFGSTHPEGYTDANGNGHYDPPSGSVPGETFNDRNGNGVRDLAVPVEGKMGGPGDVVSYTARFPAALYFRFLDDVFGSDGFPLSASTVVRNEPVRRNGLEI